MITDFNLNQSVDFTTWSRSINNNPKTSTLDHVYTNNTELIFECFGVRPIFGDHCIVVASLSTSKIPEKFSYRRDWRHYTPLECYAAFAQTDWNIDCVDVQQYRNLLENKIIVIVNLLSPIVKFSNETVNKKTTPKY